MLNPEPTDFNYDVLIVGGGLAGLSLSINLSNAGLKTALFEKEEYPFHKVCGEYVSNECLPYLNSLGLDPYSFGARIIDTLFISSYKGSFLKEKLDLGGFGISRFLLDEQLFKLSLSSGTTIFTKTRIQEIKQNTEGVNIKDSKGNSYSGKIMVGSYGKRSSLDRKLNRNFFNKRSPYMAVKYHLEYPTNTGQISLHNFLGGYAGISEIEDGKACLCYLIERKIFKKYGDINRTEREILRENPYLDEILGSARFLWNKPLIINEISFLIKEKFGSRIFFVGDSAGMIVPLFGNGMAMALRSSQILGNDLIKYFAENQDLQQLTINYSNSWKTNFYSRMKLGTLLQSGFGNTWSTEILIKANKNIPWLRRALIKASHGEPF